ncbi:metallophosphoesterase [Mycolicibacter minnesotensis]
MAGSEVQGYDIIGDVHGCADELERLLTQIGYEDASGTGEYRHPDRKVIFVGDLIDRGPGQLRVLQVAKAMVDAGGALIVMGNHEFNALSYHYEYPAGSGKHLRLHHDPDSSRPDKNYQQHKEFLQQLADEQQRRYLDWFATLPLWLDLGGLRVVHACWHPESMAVVQDRCKSDAPFADPDHLVAANDRTDPLYRAIENLLKGPEISLVDHRQPEYKDKDGSPRGSARMRWWDDDARTLRDIAEMSSSYETLAGERYPQLPEDELPAGAKAFVYTGDVPVFYGHYWRTGSPVLGNDYTDRTACVDFSAVRGHPLTAYRWSVGEATINPGNYVQLR